LRVVLSGKVWDLSWVEIDMPVLGYEQFVVDDFDGDGVKEIYVRLGRDVAVPRKWWRKRVKAGEVVIGFNKKQLMIKMFSSKAFTGKNFFLQKAKMVGNYFLQKAILF
jgi:hypothetical protein